MSFFRALEEIAAFFFCLLDVRETDKSAIVSMSKRPNSRKTKRKKKLASSSFSFSHRPHLPPTQAMENKCEARRGKGALEQEFYTKILCWCAWEIVGVGRRPSVGRARRSPPLLCNCALGYFPLPLLRVFLPIPRLTKTPTKAPRSLEERTEIDQKCMSNHMSNYQIGRHLTTSTSQSYCIEGLANFR